MLKRSIRPARGFVAPVARFLDRFRRREDGAIAIWFAVLALPLAILAFALIDVNRASVERRHLQDALDAATLLAARSNATTSEQLQAIGAAAMSAELSGMSDATLTSVTFSRNGSRVVGTAAATVVPLIANLWLQEDVMRIGASTEVLRSSINLEVALVLDITGSMSGSKIDALETASAELIDYVMPAEQDPDFYTKMAIVPFSIGVNVGDYASAARGAVTPGVSVTQAQWQSGGRIEIDGITQGQPAVVTTASNHGLSTGDTVYIEGVRGMTSLNGGVYKITRTSKTKFSLDGTNTSWSSSYSGSNGDYVYKCLYAGCAMQVTTSTAHGLATGDYATFLNVPGWPSATSSAAYEVTKVSNTVYTVPLRGSDYSAATSGSSYCTKQGCEFFRYLNSGGNPRVGRITTCATERVGGEIDTDASPKTRLVGRHYSTSNDCPSAKIVPLTISKDTLTNAVKDLPATGGTAGQIGIGWGWYMVSPTFNQKADGAQIWPAGSAPALYTAPKTLKVVIFMTDGEFNTAYCDGVTSGSISGCSNKNDKSPTEQAQDICRSMRDKGVVVYTVGFEVGGANTTAGRFVANCASSADHVFLPSGGGALKEAFAAIGKDITKLRLAK